MAGCIITFYVHVFFSTEYVYDYANWSSYFGFCALVLYICSWFAKIWDMWDLNILSTVCYGYADWSLNYLLSFWVYLGLVGL